MSVQPPEKDLTRATRGMKVYRFLAKIVSERRGPLVNLLILSSEEKYIIGHFSWRDSCWRGIFHPVAAVLIFPEISFWGRS